MRVSEGCLGGDELNAIAEQLVLRYI